ncbi:MAG: SDR family NAD(P)-dependent oxidoreductase [Oceanicaulis sp.]
MSALEGRHAVVTGGGSGIGAAIADALSRAGARVTVMGRKMDRLEGVAARLGEAQAISCDVADPGSVITAFEQARAAFGPVSILVNNAGIAPAGPFEKMAPDTLRQVLSVNVEGVFACTRAAIADLKADAAGRVINIASTAGLKAYAYASAYVASKHAVIGATRALAMEYAKTALTINAVCPGFTDTDIVSGSLDQIEAATGRSREEALAVLIRDNPQRRLIDPAEVAEACLWLCRADSRSITGQAIVVAGGEVM